MTDLLSPPMRGLGDCEQCQHPLCVRGGNVECDSCGRPHPNHPLQKEIDAARAEEARLIKANADRPVQPMAPMEMASTLPDRVRVLEGQVKQLLTRIAVLEKPAGRRAG